MRPTVKRATVATAIAASVLFGPAANALAAPMTAYPGVSIDQGTVPAIAATTDGGRAILESCWVWGGQLYVWGIAGNYNNTLQTAIDGCSVAEQGGQTWVAWTDQYEQIWYSFIVQSTGNIRATYAIGQYSNTAPALAQFNGDLVIAWTGTDGRINIEDISHNGKMATLSETTNVTNPPAINANAGYLDLAF